MGGIKFQKRQYDFFVSYGHDTAQRVAPVVQLLKNQCGLELWFDASVGNASVRSSELLSAAIGNSRGALFFLSEAFNRSSWCKGEFETALREQRAQDDFVIVPIRLDAAEPPSWAENSEIIDLRQTSPAALARLLSSLNGPAPHRFDNLHDVYLAAPWSRPSALASVAFEALASPGWRFVGDSPDSKHLREKRIEAIIRTVRGLAAVLPYDPSQPIGKSSPFILDEARIAIACGKPLLLMAEPGVDVPPDLLSAAFQGGALTLQASDDARARLKQAVDAFDDHLLERPYNDTGAFIFYAGSLLEQSDDLESVIERASNMRCIRGERLSGDNVPTEIVRLIRRAAIVVADIADDNRNTLIEAGAAMGAGTPLRLMARKPPEGAPPKKRFMFEGQEIFWYGTPQQRLGLCYFFARGVRRRVYRL